VRELEPDDVRHARAVPADPCLDAVPPHGAEPVEHGEDAVRADRQPGRLEHGEHVRARLLVHERGDPERPRRRIAAREPLDASIDVGDVREVDAVGDERADAAERPSLRRRHRVIGFGRACRGS
jgi:hypothetical protein